METEKRTNTVYQLETTKDAELQFEKIISHVDGIAQQPEVFFRMTDVSFESKGEIFTAISITEAKQMIEGLKALVKEVED